MAIAAMGAVAIRDEAENAPAPRRRQDPAQPPPPPVFTEADEKRLRAAAIKRFRRAQRMAKGMAGEASIGNSDVVMTPAEAFCAPDVSDEVPGMNP